VYGPTEVAVICTGEDVGEDPADPVPIGVPMANTRIEILDGSLERQLVGRRGELYVGGAGVAVGYYNSPELTEERFLTHPRFGRLYRTGDLCRWTAEGKLIFLGRADRQVKVRGYRIELDEIERVAQAHPAVHRAAAQLVDIAGEPNLILHVQPGVDSGLTDRILRRHLAERLPAHMLPAEVVFLRELPRTPTGKVDRKALRGSRGVTPGVRPAQPFTSSRGR
jgi:acyl-coenzyme A synthetase/AMP-(fatty) acid ligase